MHSSSLNNEISRSSFNKCIYCYEKNHLYKKNCVKFNENFKAEKIHLQKRRIHLDFYNSDVFHVRMIFYKSQRQCVENAEKLIYSNRVIATSIEVYTIRLKEDAKIEFFIDEKKEKVVLVNHEFYANVDVILIVARSKFKVFKKFAKHHEFIKRILKRKKKKEKKIVHFKNIAIEKVKEDYNEEKKRRAKSSYERNFLKKRAKERKKVREEKKTFAICFRQRKK